MEWILGLVIVIATALIIYLIYTRNQEHFDQYDFINKISTLDVPNKNTIYRENIDDISKGMTIYYSAFCHSSYPLEGNVVYNIGGKSSNKLQFSESSANIQNFSRSNGFSLGNDVFSGPSAQDLGIAGSTSFTIFFTANMKEFVKNKKKDFVLFTIPANTPNQNGISLYFSHNVSELSNLHGTNLCVSFGSHVKKSEDLSTKSHVIMINPKYTYLFVVVKSNLHISLYMYPNVNSFITQDSVLLIDKWKIDPKEEVFFSNKKMLLNPFHNVYGNFFNFGIYNYDLNETQIQSIYNHTQIEFMKNDTMIRNVTSQISKLKNENEKIKSCPYDSDTCAVCNKVKDWRNPMDIVSQGGLLCKDAINSYCSVNNKHDLCVCWNPDSILNSTDECKSYVNIFKKKDVIYEELPRHDIDTRLLSDLPPTHNFF